MLKVTVKETNSVKRELEIEAPPERVQRELDKVYKKYRRTVQIPGFRKGKVPVDIIKTRLGSAIEAEVLNDLLPILYNEAIHSQDIEPVSQASIDQIQYEEGQPLKFTASVEVKPDIDPQGYKDIRVIKEIYEVADKDVEERLKYIQEGRSLEQSVERQAKVGDLLLMDLQELSPDGVPLVGEKSEDQLKLIGGENSTSRDFDNQLVGIKKGEQRKIRFKYNEDLEDRSLAGREYQVQVAVKDVKERTVPDLDEEFAKDVGDYASLEDLRAAVRKELEREVSYISTEKMQNSLKDQIVEANDFEVPQTMVESYIEAYLSNLREKYKDVDEEKIRKQGRDEALKRIKWHVLLDAIAEKEGLEVTDEEVESRVKELAQINNMSPLEMRRRLERDNSIDNIKFDMLEEKVMSVLIDNADVKEEKLIKEKKIIKA